VTASLTSGVKRGRHAYTRSTNAFLVWAAIREEPGSAHGTYRFVIVPRSKPGWRACDGRWWMPVRCGALSSGRRAFGDQLLPLPHVPACGRRAGRRLGQVAGRRLRLVRGRAREVHVVGQRRAVVLPELRDASRFRGSRRPDLRRRHARQPGRACSLRTGQPCLDDEPPPVAGTRGQAAALRQHTVCGRGQPRLARELSAAAHPSRPLFNRIPPHRVE
jgi:hypothetical protein